MKTYNLFFLFFLFFHITSCSNNSKKKVISNDSIPFAVSSKREDSSVFLITGKKSDSMIVDRIQKSVKNGRKLRTDDSIEQYPVNQTAALKRYMEMLRKEWHNAPNPITATYTGNDFGDYHHIRFKARNDVEYDFGQAKNNYGKYHLHHLSEQYDDNPEFLGKEFKIYWEWKLSEFLCCDGAYGAAKAYLPSITKLELIKN